MNRRGWLAVSVFPIVIVMGLLLPYIRSPPLPKTSATDASARSWNSTALIGMACWILSELSLPSAPILGYVGK
jgi:hypothetical protein